MKNLYNKLKEEKIKVEDDIIKKELYYKRLHIINKKEEANNNEDLIKNYHKYKILITDKNPLDTFMPPGLIKSPNSGDFYKFNLFDEIKVADSKNNALDGGSSNKLNNRNIKNVDEESNKKNKERVMTPRMFIFKKNDPEIKFNVLSEFIEKIK